MRSLPRRQTGIPTSLFEESEMHICPEEIMAFMMTMPFIGFAFHWLRHKLTGSKCPNDETCVPRCEHQVIEDVVHDPLDP